MMYLAAEIEGLDYEGCVCYGFAEEDEDLFDSFANPACIRSTVQIDAETWNDYAERFISYRAFPSQGGAFDVLVEGYPLEDDDPRSDCIFGPLVEYWEPGELRW